MEDTQVQFGAKLKKARQEASLMQKQVAQYLMLTVSAISAIESGQRKVDALELFRLSKLYGKPMEWFFEEPHPLSLKQGIRWYDNDPLVREAIYLMQKAAPPLREKAAYGVLGFLSDR